MSFAMTASYAIKRPLRDCANLTGSPRVKKIPIGLSQTCSAVAVTTSLVTN